MFCGMIDAEKYFGNIYSNPDPKAEKAFKAADSDGDCRLSRQEWVAKFGDDKLFDA